MLARYEILTLYGALIGVAPLPLKRGFGLTMGNALRRVLLSSLEGQSIWAVRIEGVLHEESNTRR